MAVRHCSEPVSGTRLPPGALVLRAGVGWVTIRLTVNTRGGRQLPSGKTVGASPFGFVLVLAVAWPDWRVRLSSLHFWEALPGLVTACAGTFPLGGTLTLRCWASMSLRARASGHGCSLPLYQGCVESLTTGSLRGRSFCGLSWTAWHSLPCCSGTCFGWIRLNVQSGHRKLSWFSKKRAHSSRHMPSSASDAPLGWGSLKRWHSGPLGVGLGVGSLPRDKADGVHTAWVHLLCQ